MEKHSNLAWTARAWPRVSALLVSCLIACAGEDPGPEPGNPFVPSAGRGVDDQALVIDAIDKIDLLFVIDDSGSMKEEQAMLAAQFPRVARALATGDIDDDGVVDFPPPQDVQFGVISPDLGISGIPGIDRCTGVGDDGLLSSRSRGQACDGDVPPFVQYRPSDDDLEQLGRDFACLADLGTDGCGFEQPLEAALKALWPSADERVSFHGLTPDATTTGHGDLENAGFSRAEPGTVPSLLVVVVIADEDDCSAADPSIFTPPGYLPEPNALLAQGLNVRCHGNPEALYPVERYVHGLSLLREGTPQLVMFAAVAGVPPDRVDAAALAQLDDADPSARDAFYRELLDDPRMQSQVDTLGTPSPDDDALVTACETANTKAYPARRIAQVAHAFGENGLVQSICQDDLGGVLSALLGRIAHRMRDPNAR
jgi:hypothetical protein